VLYSTVLPKLSDGEPEIASPNGNLLGAVIKDCWLRQQHLCSMCVPIWEV